MPKNKKGLKNLVEASVSEENMFDMNELTVILAEQLKISSRNQKEQQKISSKESATEFTEQLKIKFKENSKETTNMLVEALDRIETTFKQSLDTGNQKGSDESLESSSNHG